MRKQSILAAATLLAALLAGPAAGADYSSTVLSFNPVAYWPLNETTAPGAGVTTATNRGTLGAGFNATYQGSVTFGVPGALVSESNTADGFDGASAQAQTPYGAGISNAPSFTIEAWLLARNTGSTQCPLSDVDGSNPRSGWLIYMAVANAGQYTFRTYNQNGTAASLSLNIGAAGSITAGQWYHLAIVVSNAVTVTNVYAYLNGALAAGPTALPAFVPSDGLHGGFSIGTRSDKIFYFNGEIDEVAYYTNALDAATVLAHYSAGTNAAPGTPYETLVQGGNPILYFRMEDPNIQPVAHNLGTLGSTANGYFQSGTVPGVAGPNFSGLPTGFGVNNYACQFSPGGTQSTTSPGPGVPCAAYNLGVLDNQSNLTLSAWVKVPASAVGWFTGPCGRGDSSYRFGLDTGGNPHFADGGGGNGDIVGGGTVNDGKWHLWTGVYNSVNSNATFYIDTTVAGTAVWNPPGGTTANAFFIGGAPDYIGRNFVGTVCQVAIFTNALSAGQVEQLYYSGAPAQFSQAVAALSPAGYWPLTETTQPPAAVSVTGTNYGTLGSSADANFVSDVVYGFPGALASDTDSADQFNGGTSELSLPFQTALGLTPPFSVEGWVYMHDVPARINPAGVFVCIDGTQNSKNSRQGWLIYENGTHFNLRIGDSTGYRFNQSGTTTLLPRQWYHVVATFDGTTATLYVNGVVDTTGAVAGYAANATQPFEVGAAAYFGRYNSMAADEVALYTNLLSSSDVLAHYQAGTNPAPATAYSVLVQQKQPILYYRLDEAPANTPYPAPLPVAANFGSLGAAAQGYYQPGTFPGIPGPTNIGFGLTSIACGFSTNDVESTAQAGPGVLIAPYAEESLNLTQAMTLAAWVQVPAGTVSWFQTPIGRGDFSYRFDVDTAGLPHFAAAPNGDVTGTTPLKDGAWHFWAGVFDPVAAKSLLYIDGIQVAQSPGSPLTEFTCYLLVGGAPDYNNRNFVGNICQVALFTNAVSAGQLQGLYNSIGAPPLIVMPTNQFYINEGANGSLAATVGGTPPLSMQWYYIDTMSNTNVATGQTSATLSLTNVQTTLNLYQYFLVVNNAYGSVTGSVATLNVAVGPPTIQVDLSPLLQQVPVGVPVTYTVQVTGSTPFYYQWYSNSLPVGINTNFYSFLAGAGSNYFYCTITNSHGPVTSSTAAVIGLTNPPPVIVFGTGSGWTTNMSTITDAGITNGVLLLTDGANSEVATLFYNIPQYIGGFVTFYTYQAANGSAPLADGATFCVQNAPNGPNAIGGGGGELGFWGISPSAAFEMNIYNGANGGIGIQFGTNGMTADSPVATPPYFPTTPVNMASLHPINVRLYYDGRLYHLLLVDATTSASYTTTYAIGDLTGIVQGDVATIGFTGATGGLNAIQTISNFRYSYTTPPVLSVARSGSSVTIAWPVSVSTFFQLQSSPNVNGPWTNVGTPPVIVGLQNTLTVVANGEAFYRLMLQ